MKPITLFTIILIAFSVISCQTTIPETDTLPPKFSLRISGDGFDRTFTQDDNFEHMQLNLRENTNYDVIFSGVDEGGLAHLEFIVYPRSFIIQRPIPAGWRTEDFTFLQKRYFWLGNRSAPLTGTVYNNVFKTEAVSDPTRQIGHFIKIFASDYGGTRRAANSVSKELQIVVGQFRTEVKDFH